MKEETDDKTFNQEDWEPCIATEKDEQAQCDKCKKIVKSKKLKEHIYCLDCNKYLWRKK